MAAIALLLGQSLIACVVGDGAATDDNTAGPSAPAGEVWVNKKPLLHAASPGAMAVGDDLIILGQDFIDKDRGRPFAHFTGNYVETGGASHAVDFQAQPTFVNTGKISWKLWPQITFSPTGDQLGHFSGTIVVTNKGNDGSELSSDPLTLAIEIKPSIVVRKMTPLDAGCSPVITDTLEDQSMELAAEVIGLREATADAPLVFHWSFLAEQWKVSTSWRVTNPTLILPKQGAINLEERVTSGRSSSLSSRSPTSFIVQALEDVLGDGSLKELKTGLVPEEGNNLLVAVNLAVTDGAGKQASLAIKLTVHRKADVSYDGGSKLAERFAPTLVSDCMNGGNAGTDVNYNESTTEERRRTLAVKWHVGKQIQIGNVTLGAMPDGSAAGVAGDNGEIVSSTNTETLALSGHILPGQWAVFYRQTSKVYRTGKVLGYNVCGQSSELGEAILTDWTFTPELATGNTCPPPSHLQPPEKLLD